MPYESSMRSLDADGELVSEITIEDEVVRIAGAGESSVSLASTYDGTHSFQAIAPDLELDAAAGSSTDPKYLAAVMGNLIGDALSKTKPILAAIIGKLSITGTRATTYSVAAVRAEIGDGVSEADAAFVAVIGGDSAAANARAVLAVDSENSTGGSGFEYGLDLYGPSHDGYNAVTVSKAILRTPSRVCVLEGAGAPSNGTTGDNYAARGSLYIDTTNGEAYLNTGTITDSVWKAITHAA